MHTLTFNVHFTAYNDSNFEIHESTHEVVIPLKENELQVITHPTVIGSSRSGGGLEAQLVIHYRYEPDLRLITFYGNDLESPDTIRLLLKSSDGAVITIHPYESRDDAFQEGLRLQLRSVNDQIVRYAEDCDLNVFVRAPLPDLAPELQESLKIVHHKGKLLELFDPQKEYDADHGIVHYQSIRFSTGKLASGQKFATVMGSTADPKPRDVRSSSWLELWRSYFGWVEKCTSHNYNGFNCTGTPLVGAHCILGDQSKPVAAGSNAVFIAPICRKHLNDQSVYMMPLENDGRVILLEGYMRD